MKEIYKLKEELLELYRTTGTPLIIATRIIIALITLVLINLNIGALQQLQGLVTVFFVSVVVGVLPISLGTIVLMCFTLGHMFAISYVAAAVIAAILAILFMFGKLFSPRESYLFVGAFIISLMGGTFAAPLMLAMVGTALGVVPMVGGVAWFSMLMIVSDMKNLLSEGSVTEALFTVLEGIVSNKSISMTLITVGVSYVIAVIVKNMAINESWKMGLLGAAISNVMIMSVGGLFTSASIPYMSLLVGTILGLGLGLIIEVFVHNVNYRAVETLRFEDDEYCYFVKAVPKKDIPKPLEIPEPTKEELRQQAREEARTKRKQVSKKGGPERVKKVTPQEKRARERAEFKRNS